MFDFSDFLKNMGKNIGIDIYKYDKNSFRTSFKRPKYSDQINVREVDNCMNESVAIVVQGGIKYEDDFTLESLKLYKKLYSTAKIILSTWSHENSEYVKKIKNNGIEVVLNEMPTSAGHGSINYQRESSKNGIILAQNMHSKYVLKTRTDQRIYGENNISYLIQLLNHYPLNIKIPARDRIAVCSNGCFSGRLYNVSDMLLFGRTEDMLRYFSCPMDMRGNSDIIQRENLIEYSKKRPGEIYFSTHYIESLGFELQWTEEDSKFFFKELFVIVDCEALDWYWPKYTHSEYRWRDYGHGRFQQYSYKDWMNMQYKAFQGGMLK